MTKESASAVSSSDVKGPVPPRPPVSTTPIASKFSIAATQQVTAQTAAQLQALTKAAAENDPKEAKGVSDAKAATTSPATASDSKAPAPDPNRMVWYVPSAALEQFENIPNAVRRHLLYLPPLLLAVCAEWMH
jgi:hypothetical protein